MGTVLTQRIIREYHICPHFPQHNDLYRVFFRQSGFPNTFFTYSHMLMPAINIYMMLKHGNLKVPCCSFNIGRYVCQFHSGNNGISLYATVSPSCSSCTFHSSSRKVYEVTSGSIFRSYNIWLGGVVSKSA